MKITWIHDIDEENGIESWVASAYGRTINMDLYSGSEMVRWTVYGDVTMHYSLGLGKAMQDSVNAAKNLPDW